jgi:hypothetical protein
VDLSRNTRRENGPRGCKKLYHVALFGLGFSENTRPRIPRARPETQDFRFVGPVTIGD